jgi:hypothetical protein
MTDDISAYNIAIREISPNTRWNDQKRTLDSDAENLPSTDPDGDAEDILGNPI